MGTGKLKLHFSFSVVLSTVLILSFYTLVEIPKVSAALVSTGCSISSTLKKGSKGTEVRCLQASLGGLIIDGLFGSKTKINVMDFQKSHQLKVDGIFGSKSRAAWISLAVSETIPVSDTALGLGGFVSGSGGGISSGGGESSSFSSSGGERLVNGIGLGRHFIDPDFGTELIQVTNSSDGSACVNAYSYWPSFNKGSTKFFLACDDNPILYNFDPDNFQITSKIDLFSTNPSDSISDWEDAIWSGIDVNILYAHTGLKLWQYNVTNRTYTLVKDFSQDLPGGFLFQMSKSLDDNRFAFTTKDPNNNYAITGYIVWDKAQNKIIYQINTSVLDEVQLDKSGKYLVVKTGQISRTGDAVMAKIVDLQTLKVTDLVDGAPDFAPGHSDNGQGILLGSDRWNNSLDLRTLSNPHSYKNIFSMGNDWTQAMHLSLLADDEQWALVSLFTPGGLNSGKYHDEIILVSIDGNGQIKELAHHHSIYNDYWDSPRADISRDGKFVVFTSNWDGSRRDVFVLKVK